MHTVEKLTPLQRYQRMMFLVLNLAADKLNPEELDALRQTVVLRLDRVADKALGE